MYKLLIVDDEPDIVNLLKDFFEMHGYSVMTAKNGREALDKSLQKPDLILLDVNLPDVDGFSVCARIRNLVVCPILFLTAKITENDLLNGFHVGGDDYIVKPFSLQTLPGWRLICAEKSGGARPAKRASPAIWSSITACGAYAAAIKRWRWHARSLTLWSF